jgi:hypothetical protein
MKVGWMNSDSTRWADERKTVDRTNSYSTEWMKVERI